MDDFFFGDLHKIRQFTLFINDTLQFETEQSIKNEGIEDKLPLILK